MPGLRQEADNTVEHGDAGAAVAFEGVAKAFGAVRAVSDLDLRIEVGKVHALVGENGAGKSTCLGMLAGRIAPTSGTVRVFGEELRHGDPRAARAAGVVAIYQELTIVPHLSAQANVFLGMPKARRGWLDEREMRRRYEGVCSQLGVQAAPASVPAGSLSVAEQQLLEVMRALIAEARIILFDEPTASLGMHERAAMLRLIDDLRGRGITVAFVSHNLDEVLGVADTISVFRNGRLAATRAAGEWTKAQLVQQMLGHDSSDRLAEEMLEDSTRRPRRRGGASLIRVEGLTVPGCVDDVGFELKKGEVVGIGGLVGSGRTTVLRALAGLEPRAVGRLWVEGEERAWPRSVRLARAYGIALLPEDRKGEGLALQMSAMENVTMASWPASARAGLLSRRRTVARATAAATAFGFDPDRIGEVAGNLSGGNQQKLLLARWRCARPKVLLADEPTRGIDIGAKHEIIDALDRMAGEGLGIVVVSSELEEVATLSDHVVVLAEGRVAGSIDREEEEVTMSAILHTAFEVEEAHAAA